MFKRTKLVLLLSIPLFISGCVDWVDDTQDLKRFVAKAQNQPKGKIEPLPEFKPYHSFVYEGASMREPFTPLVPIIEQPVTDNDADDREPGTELAPDENREKEYLETFPLDRLIMVGTITMREGDGLWALIRDQNSELHRVAVGDFMGLHHGEIVSLDERQINLLEIVSNGRGGWMKRPRSLALSEQE